VIDLDPHAIVAHDPRPIQSESEVAMESKYRNVTLLVFMGLLGGGCESQQGHHASSWRNINEVICVVHPTNGNRCHGVVRFRGTSDGVQITAEISGLNQNQKHGFHIHQFGDCSDPSGKSAGGHYDPEGGGHHSQPDERVKHAGDLGNLQAGHDGVARYDRVVRGISIAGLTNPIVGRAIIVHAKEDDFGQPTGNAGARIGCGVIGIARMGK